MPDAPMPSPGQPQPKKTNWLLWILGGCGCVTILVIGGCVAAMWLGVGKLVQPLKDHLAKLHDGKIEAAYEDTSSAFKKATSLEEYKKFCADQKTVFEGSVAAGGSFKAEGGEIVIEVKVTGTDGKEHNVRAIMVNEGGVLKINNLKID